MTSVAYCLSWFSKDDELAGEGKLNITPDEIRQWFDLDADDPAYECYEVTENQAANLRTLITHTIDFTKFDYFVDCYDPNR